jgi:hypothetical protein
MTATSATISLNPICLKSKRYLLPNPKPNKFLFVLGVCAMPVVLAASQCHCSKVNALFLFS